MSPPDVGKLDILRKRRGRGDRRFPAQWADVRRRKVFPATIQNIECAVILPSRSHYSDIMEVLCKYNLRRTLGLADGDIVEIRIRAE